MNLGVKSSSVGTERQTKDSFAISFAPLSLEKVYSLADDSANGAVVVMSGTVRNQTNGGPADFSSNFAENFERHWLISLIL